MKQIALILAMFTLCASYTIAQERAGNRTRDPKKTSALVAKKLSFTDAQKAQLNELDKKYPGADFDKEKYREEFRNIMTEDQKKKMAELKTKREGTKHNRHIGNK